MPLSAMKRAAGGAERSDFILAELRREGAGNVRGIVCG